MVNDTEFLIGVCVLKLGGFIGLPPCGVNATIRNSRLCECCAVLIFCVGRLIKVFNVSIEWGLVVE